MGNSTCLMALQKEICHLEVRKKKCWCDSAKESKVCWKEVTRSQTAKLCISWACFHTHLLKHKHTMHLCRIVLSVDSTLKELDICFPNHLRHLLSVCAERGVSRSSTKAPFTCRPYLSKRVSLQLPETTSSLFHPL